MANPQPPTKVYLHYLYDDATKIIYYCEEMPDRSDLIYLGQSDNPRMKMAAAAFVRQNKVKEGYRIRRLTD